MKYDPTRHQRRSIRLKGFDYAQPGPYFVTICVQYRELLFGDVVGEEMRLNDAGRVVQRWWTELPNKFPMVQTDEHVVMPTHVHGIMVITENAYPATSVGATPGGRLEEPGHPQRGAPTLGEIVGWFKTKTTNDYILGVQTRGWTFFPGRLWQRNDYEHVIRSEGELERVRQYIQNNPARWELDEENPANQKPLRGMKMQPSPSTLLRAGLERALRLGSGQALRHKQLLSA